MIQGHYIAIKRPVVRVRACKHAALRALPAQSIGNVFSATVPVTIESIDDLFEEMFRHRVYLVACPNADLG
jgi:hypothetical protein